MKQGIHPPASVRRRELRNSRHSIRAVAATTTHLHHWDLCWQTSLLIFIICHLLAWYNLGMNSTLSWTQSTYLFPAPAASTVINRESSSSSSSLAASRKRTVAYLTSLTNCPSNEKERRALVDTAAVLKESIHLSSSRNPESLSRYDYDMYVFMHPTAMDCEEDFEQIGYNILIRHTPVSYDEFRNETFRERLYKGGCCGEKELLKLYSYTMREFTLVLHLDFDTMILRPLDDLFHPFFSSDNTIYFRHGHWPKDKTFTRQVEAMFTRDYPLSKAGTPSHQVGIQGGFLLVRPNQTVFDEILDLVRQGNFRNGWFDGQVHFPSFHGSAHPPGLLAFYYGHYHGEKMIELDPCLFNNYAQNPKDSEGKCRFPMNGTCVNDCRTKDISELYSAHLTYCYKPTQCPNNASYSIPRHLPRQRLCLQLQERWHNLRYTIEKRLGTDKPYETDDPRYGHCLPGGDKFGKYIPMQFDF